ncbi:MAG TPA: peptidoglycan-binding protein [Candidatus Paceibacterota bacterium]
MKTVSSVVAFALLTLPLAASADQVSDLQAQVKVLQELVAQLQAKKAALPVSIPPSSCAAITTMGPGSSGTGVSQLQQLLARDSAIYPEAKVSGYYGSLTLAAVQRFQVKNNIVSTGLPSTTGYGRVGPKTLAAILAQCGLPGQGGTSVITTNSDPVGGFIQVSPISGSAPLYVSVQATINTTASCGAATYTLDFGDGSAVQQIPLTAGTCQSAQQTYTHTYSTVGTYAVVLAAGQHSSSATVVVQ